MSLPPNFCKQNSQEMLDYLDIAIKHFSPKGVDVPLVMIGHSKDFLGNNDLESFIETVITSYSESCKFSSFEGVSKLVI